MPEARPKHRTEHRPVNRDDAYLLAAARQIGSRVEIFLAWKRQEDGSLVVIDYDGRKYQFAATELER